MKRTTKIQLSLAAGLAVAVLASAFVISRAQPDSTIDADTVTVVAENSHRLDTAPEGSVVFTEFLDFECEVCLAVHPYVEQLREEYAGRVTFVTRYFPIPAHKNSMNAAVAVEAAAQQGQFEAMYQRMFDTQTQWGEQQGSKASLFRSFADELGLDLAAYDAVVSDPATKARVQQDFDAGIALGVTGTPTIFLNDTQLELTSPDALLGEVERAVTAQEQQ
ncbi:DsbA family protein [Clavibacter capsici]|uniref:DsbA family protein n=1 Tax=Clavibacter capsici TaxID=1874630 RepID=UPI0006B15D1A|nr:thioredoxin domain-containing protein [Clavibacter capsici]ALD14323.1 disulfide bond formation protein DsbA [Clavibacter capsici]ALD14349.1 disulfide bond formation protein DsbA [Clavibacter capsici]